MVGDVIGRNGRLAPRCAAAGARRKAKGCWEGQRNERWGEGAVGVGVVAPVFADAALASPQPPAAAWAWVAMR